MLDKQGQSQEAPGSLGPRNRGAAVGAPSPASGCQEGDSKDHTTAQSKTLPEPSGKP